MPAGPFVLIISDHYDSCCASTRRSALTRFVCIMERIFVELKFLINFTSDTEQLSYGGNFYHSQLFFFFFPPFWESRELRDCFAAVCYLSRE